MGNNNPYLERIDVQTEECGMNHYERIFEFFSEHTDYADPMDRFTTFNHLRIPNDTNDENKAGCYNKSPVDGYTFKEHLNKTRNLKKYGYQSMGLNESNLSYYDTGSSVVTSRIEMNEYTVETALGEFLEPKTEFNGSSTIEYLIQSVIMHDNVSREYAERMVQINMATLLKGVVSEMQIVHNHADYSFGGENMDIGGIDLIYTGDAYNQKYVQLKSMKDLYNNNHDSDYKLLCYQWIDGKLVLSDCANKLTSVVKQEIEIQKQDFHKVVAFCQNPDEYWSMM